MRQQRSNIKTSTIGLLAVITAAGTLTIAPAVGAVDGTDAATTIIGDAPLAAPPDGEGLPGEVTFVYDADSVAVHPWTGEVYWADSETHRIRKLDRDGLTWTVAGDGTAGFAGDDGDAFEARFDRPRGLAFDGDGNLFIADTNNHRIRRIDTLGLISTVAGTGAIGEGEDIGDNGSAVDAELAYPSDVTVHESGRFFFVADSGHHRVRRVNVGGIITTAVGSTQGFSGDLGGPLDAQLSFPESVALDDLFGVLYISDLGNQRIRAVTESNIIVTVAGDGTSTFDEGAIASETGIGAARDLAVDRFGIVYFSDHVSDTIRRIEIDGTLTTISGVGSGGSFGDAIQKRYLNPTAVAIDRFDRLLVGDIDTVVRISADAVLPPLDRLNPYGRPAEDQVRRLYRAAFGRVPEAGGLQFWVNRYYGGDTMLSMAAEFIASRESIAIFDENPTDEEFVTIVYSNVLRRVPDAEGLAFWLDQLDDGRTRASVLVSFADSIENIERTSTAPPMTDAGMEVLRLYRAAFGRVPDSGGFDFWLARRNTGDSLSVLATQFIASPEASGYLDNPEDSLFIEALYGNVLNRNADDAGLRFWEAQMEAGTSRADVLVAFSESPENRQLTGTA